MVKFIDIRKYSYMIYKFIDTYHIHPMGKFIDMHGEYS